MDTYPTGVIQNLTAGGLGVPDLKPVDKDNWWWFSTRTDADIAMTWASDPNLGLFRPTLVTGTTGMYSQFIYVREDSDVRVYLINAAATDDQGIMFISDYAGGLFDRNTDPLEGVDGYVAGEPHVLKLRRITETLGQLYWDVA